MFASRVVKEIKVKVTNPESVAFLGTDVVDVTIRKLSGRSLEKIRQQKSIEQAPPLRAYGAELLKGLQKELDEAAKALAAAKAAKDTDSRRKERYDAHDRVSTLVAGIVRWSCQDKVALEQKSIEDLDEDVMQRIHEEIVDLSCGPLTAEEAQAQEGESTGRSTAS